MVAVLLMFFIPVCFIGLKKDSIIQVDVEKKTSEFVELVTTQGYMTRDMYERYQIGLKNTGKLYDIELLHEQKAFEPEYKFRSASEVIEEDESLWEGVNEYIALPVTTEVPVITDPIDNSGLTMNTETNASILAAAVNTPALPGHVHTDACYAGHVHKGKENLNFSHSHTHGSVCKEYTSGTYYDVVCNTCGAAYRTCVASYHLDQYGNLVTDVVDVTEINNCRNCGSPQPSKTQILARAYSCGYSIDITGDGLTDTVLSGVNYNYLKSYPQSNNRATYTKGCYVYHKTMDFTDLFEYAGVDCINLYDAFIKLRNTGFSIYCSVPIYYSLGISASSDEDDPPNEYVTYKAVILNNTVTFTFVNYRVQGRSISTVNPGFPVLNETAFINACSVTGINALFRNSTGSDLTSKYSNPGAQQFRVSYSETIKICPENHTVANKWVTTCGLVEDTTLICNQKVVSIVPTHPTQAVYVGEALITTAVATYLDGSTRTVLCTTPFTSAVPVSNKSITLTYVDAKNGTTTCTVIITVIPKIKTCTKGHSYNINNDGSDPGCPYCHNLLRSLSVAVPSSGRLTMFRNVAGNLEAEGVGLLAIYLDGHMEYIYSGYVDNLDPDYVGTQMVSIGYKGLKTTLQVEIFRNKRKCDVCGLFYNLYIDDTDPGCPYCKARVPVFTGNVMHYCKAVYEDEIITELYEGVGTYYFRHGDGFSVKAQSRNKLEGLTSLARLFKLTIWVHKTDSVKDEIIHN
jgi:hypothetical protein